MWKLLKNEYIYVLYSVMAVGGPVLVYRQSETDYINKKHNTYTHLHFTTPCYKEIFNYN